jgi:hypothetical protein
MAGFIHLRKSKAKRQNRGTLPAVLRWPCGYLSLAFTVGSLVSSGKAAGAVSPFT